MKKPVSKKIIIRLKENLQPFQFIPTGQKVKISRLYDISPKVKAYKENYPDSGNIPDVELFAKLIYPKMTNTEQKLYRTYVVESTTMQQARVIFESLSLEEAKDKGVEYVQYDLPHILYYTPNDPQLGSAWGISKIECQQAWDISRGNGIIVAVIDTGVDHGHPDIEANMWQDAAGNHGKNIIDNNYDTMDKDWHGTHVAGIVAAVADNKEGLAGVAPGASVMAVKVFPAPTDSQLANGIIYAVDAGARVINNSWGPETQRPENETLSDAIDYACEVTESKPGTVVVCAAGNKSDDVQFYAPANHPKVITVAAVKSDDTLIKSSNYGAQVAVAAPGHLVKSLLSDLHDSIANGVYGYAAYSGTSMAAAFVSGLAALVLSIKPELTPDQVKAAIQANCNFPVNTAQPTHTIGGGRINALSTVSAV